MESLVSIGRFSQLTGLTIKALRLYDRLGLLRPAVVDFPSGFRYYDLEQIAQALHIRFLRSLEMPLEEIRVILSTPDPRIAERHLLAHRQRIEERISRDKHILALLTPLIEQNKPQRKEQCMQPEQEQPDGSKRPAYQCSFCGKEHHEVKRLIAGKVRHRCILRPVPCYHQEMFLKVRTQILDIDKGNRIAQSCFASRANTKQEPGFNRNPI